MKMINKDKLREYIEAFRRPPNPNLINIQAELEKVSLELMRLQFMVIEIANALGVKTEEK
jgi:hypothetical protein